MSKSTHEDNDNIKTNDLVTNDETLIQDNLEEEDTETQSTPSESLLFQDDIQTTLKEFNQKINENDRSIKRIEESMAALYYKLDRTPEAEESKTSSKKKSKKKKGRKLDKKGKKGKRLDKKNGKKLKGKGKTKASENFDKRRKKEGSAH